MHKCSFRNITPLSQCSPQTRPKVTPVTPNLGLIPQVSPRPADEA